MALSPAFKSHRLGSPTARHTLEFYLDYVCPFSAKIAQGIRDDLLPLLKGDEEAVSIIFRQTPQPWHASSTLVHEAGIAVAHLAPHQFWTFSHALFEQQKSYFDEPTAAQTPEQIRKSLAALAKSSVGIDEAAFLDQVSGAKSNGGNKTTNDLKLAIKYGRQNGIHVTPTVARDGLIDNAISSSFTRDDWKKYIEEFLQ